MSVKKICVITGSRAEYGLLKNLMKKIQNSKKLSLQVIVTGTHLSKKHGFTYREIEDDGFHADFKVDMKLNSDNSSEITKSMGLAMIGFSNGLEKLCPDMVVLLGDRYEIFSAAAAALIAKVPIAHLHGGESTEGAFDEAIRHSITKMSQLHFVAADEYRQRVIQLGENPTQVFKVGALGVDRLKNMSFVSRSSIEKLLKFKFQKKNLLVTFHPTTLEQCSAASQFKELLHSFQKLENTNIIFTMPNADPSGHDIRELIHRYTSKNSNSFFYESLGLELYLSVAAQVDAVIGNSSSGIIEVPSLNKATINIGDRQKGRLKANSIVDCKPNRESIQNALELVYSSKYQSSLSKVQNPYGPSGASDKIFEILENYDFSKSLKKKFFDLASI